MSRDLHWYVERRIGKKWELICPPPILSDWIDDEDPYLKYMWRTETDLEVVEKLAWISGGFCEQIYRHLPCKYSDELGSWAQGPTSWLTLEELLYYFGEDQEYQLSREVLPAMKELDSDPYNVRAIFWLI